MTDETIQVRQEDKPLLGRGALAGLAAGALALAFTILVPAPAGLPEAGWRVLGLALLMAVWWSTEPVPMGVTALMPLIVMPLLGIVDLQRAAAAYANPLIFLFLVYLLHTTGELCLSPVGLSAMTRLAAPRMVGLLMGTWFFAQAGGNYLAGLIATATRSSEDGVIGVYTRVGWLAVIAGIAVLALAPMVLRLMHTSASVGGRLTRAAPSNIDVRTST